jgi:hypothetical protein
MSIVLMGFFVIGLVGGWIIVGGFGGIEGFVVGGLGGTEPLLVGRFGGTQGFVVGGLGGAERLLVGGLAGTEGVMVGGGFGGTERFADWMGGRDGMQEYTTVLAQVRLADLTEYTCVDDFTADEGIGSFREVV